MLTEQEIQQALHASRIVPLSVRSPHGPLGLEQLAEEVAKIMGSRASSGERPRIRRPIELPVETWEMLEHLASTAAQATAGPMTASEVAAAIIETTLARTQ